MDLEIELAWCNHWVRNRLGIPSNGSIVLFVEDARDDALGSQRSRRQSLQHAISEARWQFANPVFVMLSIVDRSMRRHLGSRAELHGLVDLHQTSNNATDLCGWIGASRSILILSAPLATTNSKQINKAKEPSKLHKALKDICSGFGKPWNLIPPDTTEIDHLKLDWESLHQPNPIDRHSNPAVASINFAQAIKRLEDAMQQTNALIEPPQKTTQYRQAG